jgi:sRNA-binding carbon storage regulator CsrA
MVKHSLRIGTTIEIGDVKIRLDHKAGQQVSLVIDAPSDIKIKLPPKSKDLKDCKQN